MEKVPPWLYLLFLLSGFSALIYEVVWVRQLGLVLGTTAQSSALVVSVFLFGLGLGAFVGFPTLGIASTLAMAVAVNLFVGVLALAMSVLSMHEDNSPANGGEAPVTLAVADNRTLLRALMTVAALSGFVAVGGQASQPVSRVAIELSGNRF